ncbi:hypothetical protein G5B40_18650 [Pikeienuella piscinae]|uniref:Glycosyltransferase RgtA/B/C/D-like domain-containing protein n=1 Tax=Pikeienuella piscinae TaxID=2748098 RepID=A0A7M3T5K0_9RHOB|nr:hypothetical protein [Pikeienuella piscinae]QIE57281.1 hypothetical protein G5B40_18650 [Pikeienuella piscinae]
MLERFRKSGATRAAFFIALGVLVYFSLYPVFLQGKVVSHDDVALFEVSTRYSPSYWFTVGYAEYFARPGFAFIRPFSNALMAADHAIFGDAYALYYVPYFALLGCGAAACAALALRLGLPVLTSCACGVFVLLQPAAIASSVQGVAFQQDALSGVFCLFAALACARRTWLVAAGVLLVAVFTKEIALYAPLSAALWALVYLRSPRVALLLVVPFVVWVALRIGVVGSLADNAYAVSGGVSGFARNLLRGFAVWPTALANGNEIKEMVGDILRTGPAALVDHPAAVVAVMLNLAIDALVAIAVIGGLRRLVFGGEERREVDGLVLLMALGGFVLLAVAANSARFAPAFHPFLLLLLARMVQAPAFAPRIVRPAAAAVTLGFVAAMAFSTVGGVRAMLADVEPASFKALARAVQAEPPVENGRILVINGPTTGSAPHWLMEHWGRPDEALVFLSRSYGCLRASGAPAPDYVTAPSGRLRIEISLPDCAEFFVYWNQDPNAFLELRTPRVLGGGGTIYYSFPEARVGEGLLAGATPDVAFGRRIVAEIDPADFDRILALDWNTGAFVPFGPPAE